MSWAYLVCGGGDGGRALGPSEDRFCTPRGRRLVADEPDEVLFNGAPSGFGSAVAKLSFDCRREEASLTLDVRGIEFWLPLASDGGKYSS